MQVHIGRYPNDNTVPRQVDVRIDTQDVWNLSETLAWVIHPSLIRLRREARNIPSVDDQDVPLVLHGEGHEKERWDHVMGEMIWAFEQKLVGDWRVQYMSQVPADPEDEDAADTEIDYEGYSNHEMRMQAGFLLFGKYYEALWT